MPDSNWVMTSSCFAPPKRPISMSDSAGTYSFAGAVQLFKTCQGLAPPQETYQVIGVGFGGALLCGGGLPAP